MSISDGELPYPGRACTPWCTSAPGHAETQHPEDRLCWSDWDYVALSRHRPYRSCDERWYVDRLGIVLEQRHDVAEPVILVHHEGDQDPELPEFGMRLTLVEAHALHVSLGRLLELEGAMDVTE